ncbi:jg17093 [Pararge aegeria aegeria]|uniref:Jg17093 protein n=1 Tax=Pararge aegeria aegeria TaxID=348720 RepID=A0A8S4R3M5_9NEOP|nr:jg17093 [Pararge aegeria aegeria]
MNETEKNLRTNYQNRFICSICLNKKASQEDNRNVECCRKKTMSCPICQKNCDTDENKTVHKKSDYKGKDDKAKIKDKSDSKDINGKNIQTSQPDVTKGLTLLNEVLTVFQTKKQLDFKKDNTSKTVIVKDASVETEKRKPKLRVRAKHFYIL